MQFSFILWNIIAIVIEMAQLIYVKSLLQFLNSISNDNYLLVLRNRDYIITSI